MAGRRRKFSSLSVAHQIQRLTRFPSPIECRLQVNYVALSLLGILLLPKMISTAERFSTHPRMIFVGSEVHLLAKFEKSLVEGDHPLKTFGSKEYCTPECVLVSLFRFFL